MVPGPNTSQAAPGPPVSAYLLRGVKIERSHQVWSGDLPSIPMPKGFVSLT